MEHISETRRFYGIKGMFRLTAGFQDQDGHVKDASGKDPYSSFRDLHRVQDVLSPLDLHLAGGLGKP